MKALFEKHKAELREALLGRFDQDVKSYTDFEMFWFALPPTPQSFNAGTKETAKKTRKREKSLAKSKPRPIRRKKMSREDADHVREVLGGFRKNSTEREEARAGLMEAHGYSRKQIAAAEHGLANAKARRKKKRRAKK